MKIVIVFMVALAAFHCQGQDNNGTQSSDSASQAAGGQHIECYGVICNPGTMQCAARADQGSNDKNWTTIVECLDENGNVLNRGVATNQGNLANAHKKPSTEKNGFGIVIGDPKIFSRDSGKLFSIGGLSISGGLVFGSGGSNTASDNADSRTSSNNGGLDSFFGKGGSGKIFSNPGSGSFLGNNGFGKIFGNPDSGSFLGNNGFGNNFGNRGSGNSLGNSGSGNLPNFASNVFSSANGGAANPTTTSGNSGIHSSNHGSEGFSGNVDPGSYISTSTNSSSYTN